MKEEGLGSNVSEVCDSCEWITRVWVNGANEVKHSKPTERATSDTLSNYRN